MKNIKFNLLVCVDTENKIVNESDIRLAVIRKLDLGNYVSEYILKELRRKFEPEEGSLDGFIDDAITFFDWSDYIIINNTALIIDSDGICFNVNCEFDVEKWAKVYSLEEIQEDIEEER